MEQKKRQLDQYAEEHHDGSIKKAIWDLLHTADKDTFHEYVKEMNEEEASFTLDLIEYHTIRKLGGEENYEIAYRAEELSQQIGISSADVKPDTPNPFKKALLCSILLILGAIVLPVVLLMILNSMGAEAGWVYAVSSIAIGLCSMNLATALIKFCKFRKMQRLLASLPEPQKDLEPPTFEECMAFCRDKYAKK